MNAKYDAAVSKELEKMMLDDPARDHLNHAFLKIAKTKKGIYGWMVVPVWVNRGRKSFGKPQFLVRADGGQFELGEKWVGRDKLIMEHELEFEKYMKGYPPFQSANNENQEA